MPDSLTQERLSSSLNPCEALAVIGHLDLANVILAWRQWANKKSLGSQVQYPQFCMVCGKLIGNAPYLLEAGGYYQRHHDCPENREIRRAIGDLSTFDRRKMTQYFEIASITLVNAAKAGYLQIYSFRKGDLASHRVLSAFELDHLRLDVTADPLPACLDGAPCLARLFPAVTGDDEGSQPAEVNGDAPDTSSAHLELRKAPERQISAAITAAYDKAETEGVKPPNKELPRLVQEALAGKGYRASQAQIAELAEEPTHAVRRLKQGQRQSVRPG